MAIRDRRGQVSGVELFWHEADTSGGRAPVLYVHGAPTSGDDWLPFLERTGGLAPDLPGFGRSGKPAHFDYSIGGYATALADLLAQLEIERYSLVVHGWGGAALALAQRQPERVERLVVIDSLPLFSAYRWHRRARIWRTPLAGEFAMGLVTRRGLERALQGATSRPGELAERVWRHFDHGTQRAILKLHRSAPSAVLDHAGAALGQLHGPALILWGQNDPYFEASLARRFADALGGDTRVELLPTAGHWPWIDDPRAIETVVEFLLA